MSSRAPLAPFVFWFASHPTVHGEGGATPPPPRTLPHPVPRQ